MKAKNFLTMLALGGLVVHMASQADLLSQDSTRQRELRLGPNKNEEAGLNTLSPMGEISAESYQETVDMMDLGDRTGFDPISVKLIDEESKKRGPGELMDVLFSTPPFEKRFSTKGASTREDYDAENLDRIDGFWKNKHMLITEPFFIGIIAALGIGVIWGRRKLFL